MVDSNSCSHDTNLDQIFKLEMFEQRLGIAPFVHGFNEQMVAATWKADVDVPRTPAKLTVYRFSLELYGVF